MTGCARSSGALHLLSLMVRQLRSGLRYERFEAVAHAFGSAGRRPSVYPAGLSGPSFRKDFPPRLIFPIHLWQSSGDLSSICC